MGRDKEHLVIVIPQEKMPWPHCRSLLNADIFGHPVRVDSIELPMEKGPEACREAIIALCGDKAMIVKKDAD